jgi:hypothetical protein
MSFGGGGSAPSAVTAHKHNSQSGEGSPIQFNNSIITGSSMQINSGTEMPIEVLL